MSSLNTSFILCLVLIVAVIGMYEVVPYILNFDDVLARHEEQKARLVELEERQYSCEKSGGEWKAISKGDYICLKNKNYYVE